MGNAPNSKSEVISPPDTPYLNRASWRPPTLVSFILVFPLHLLLRRIDLFTHSALLTLH